MNILIADDEPLARSRLRRIVEDMNQHTIVGEAADGKEVLLKSGELRPDLIFLDIRMPGMDGLETAMHLSNLDNPPAIIFTTAFSEHALAAFESEAVDYLLKPIRRERLEQALSKARKLNRAQLQEIGKNDQTDHSRTHLSAQISGNIKLVPIEDVYFFQADQKYVTVRYSGGEVIIDESLKSLEEEFGERFVRIHRNALVAKHVMEGLERTTNGSWVIKIRDVDSELEVSRRHMTHVRKMLKEARL